ncbi:MAG: hypothetical protein SPF46_04330, partial [Blautia sp.]|nr:hypothetical protein [Blautia sp.]
MKTTEFKVHTIYSKQDILQMEKVSTRIIRMRLLLVTLVAFLLYFAVVVYGIATGKGHVSLFPEGTNKVVDVILLAAMVICIIIVLVLPYWNRNKILKNVPGGVLKANYYFYEKTFQYGWGSTFSTTAYVDITVFKELENSFYI